jgi:hypothetical protein
VGAYSFISHVDLPLSLTVFNPQVTISTQFHDLTSRGTFYPFFSAADDAANYLDSSAISINSYRRSRYQCRFIVTVNYLNYLGIQLDGNVAIEVAVDVSIQK